MTAIPLTRYLTDFGADGKAEARSEARLLAAQLADMTAKLAESHARGVEEGKAAAQAKFASELDEHRARSEQRIVDARHAWAASEGAIIGERLVAGLAEVEQRLAETMARILQPFLSGQVRKQAINDLAATLIPMLAKEKGVRLEISGPQDLLDALRGALAGKAEAVYTTNDAPDVRVVMDQTLIETQLAAWMARIEESAR